MVPARRYPGACTVALIAGKSCRRVTGMFAFCGSSIVAGGALPRCRRSMIVAGAQKSGGVEVAAFARRIGQDVACGFRRGYDTLAECMTAIAVLWRAFEHPIHMAGFADCRGVPAG